MVNILFLSGGWCRLGKLWKFPEAEFSWGLKHAWAATPPDLKITNYDGKATDRAVIVLPVSSYLSVRFIAIKRGSSNLFLALKVDAGDKSHGQQFRKEEQERKF